MSPSEAVGRLSQTEDEFESEVRRIARALWPSAEDQGATKLHGRERDGIYIGDQTVNVVEATVSRKAQKAREDGKKVALALKALTGSYPMKAAMGWFVTSDDPTAEQRNEITNLRDSRIRCVSFNQFRSQIVDSRNYLELRDNHPFGSARNPSDESFDVLDEYLELGLTDPHRPDHRITLKSLIGEVRKGRSLVLTGDYGAGKSMTLRELHRRLRGDFLRSRHDQFPITLNLREHQGQASAEEALGRHARLLGYPYPEHLVRAWKAGYAIVLLDGFDELAAINWTPRHRRLQAARRRATSLVRSFCDGTPRGSAIVVAGRSHYFDTDEELHESLDLPGDAREVSLSDFTTEQVEDYLQAIGVGGNVPDWLPTRPLLLGHLAHRGFLDRAASEYAESPAIGWHKLIDAICAREAKIEAGLDPSSVRLVLEHLATLARRAHGGMGPLSSSDIIRAFEEAVGYSPEEDSMVLLARLPGLGPAEAAPGERQFIDESLVGVARGGDLYRFVQSPFTHEFLLPVDQWQAALLQVGVESLALRLEQHAWPPAMLTAALRYASDAKLGQATADLCRVLAYIGVDSEEHYTVDAAVIDELHLADFGMHSLAKIRFRDCMVHELHADGVDHPLPGIEMVACAIGDVEGVVSRADLPCSVDDETWIAHFAGDVTTTSGIMRLNMSIQERVLLTVLKKLFLQRGKGRKDSALRRGLDTDAQRYVDAVIDLLVREGLMTHSKAGNDDVWLPRREHGPRVRTLLSQPNTSSDGLLEKSRTL